MTVTPFNFSELELELERSSESELERLPGMRLSHGPDSESLSPASVSEASLRLRLHHDVTECSHCNFKLDTRPRYRSNRAYWFPAAGCQ